MKEEKTDTSRSPAEVIQNLSTILQTWQANRTNNNRPSFGFGSNNGGSSRWGRR